MRKLTDTHLTLSAWAGIAAPALFVAVFLIEGFLRPGYNALSMYVSALSLGPRGWIQIANFLLLGVLLFIFSRGAASEFHSGKAPRGGIVLLRILAFCFFFSGLFIMDPQGTPVGEATIHGTIHGILGAVAFMLMPVSIFVFLHRFQADPNWAALRGWSLLLGTISAAALIVLSIVTKLPQLQSAFESWFGLIQRLLITPFMVWVFVFAITLLRKIKTRG